MFVTCTKYLLPDPDLNIFKVVILSSYSKFPFTYFKLTISSDSSFRKSKSTFKALVKRAFQAMFVAVLSI